MSPCITELQRRVRNGNHFSLTCELWLLVLSLAKVNSNCLFFECYENRSIHLQIWNSCLIKFCYLCVLVDPATFLTKFQWDSAKYPIKQPLRTLAEIISKVIHLYFFNFVFVALGFGYLAFINHRL